MLSLDCLVQIAMLRSHTINANPPNNPNVQSNSLKIFTSNVRGLIKNWHVIEQIDTNKYDLLLFNEIWQIRSFEHLKIPNFKLASIYQRENTRGGGVIVFIRETVNFKLIESPIVEGIIESTSILINNLIITSVYRPPSGSKPEFTEKLIDWVETLGNKKVFIAGDFNLNCLNEDIEFFRRIENNTNLKHKINTVTRIASNSCIDNVLTNSDGKHSVSSTCIADHQGIISSLKIKTNRIAKKLFKYREMKEPNWNNFTNEIEKITIRGTNINEKWTNLTDDVKKAVEVSFPEKESKNNYNFCMSRGLLKSKNKKNKLLRKYNRGEIEKEVYIQYNRVYRKLIAKETETSFINKIEEAGSDSKKKWRTLKQEMKMNEERHEISTITSAGNTITNRDEIAKEFKKHFETCANALAANVPNAGECEVLIDQQEQWGFHTITEAELLKVIDTMLPKSSCGFDLLSNKMLKKEKTRFAKLLITKKGDKTNLNNYRPISLLPVLSKLLEKVLNQQITKKLDELHLIDDNQYGFRTGHSTEDAIVKFIDVIEKAKTKHKYVISIHIDVSKAFDSCNHEILRTKLKRMGMNQNSFELMSSYMKDRVQEIWIEHVCGGRFIINIGVGQGTVLGPTLFKIYIMDMFRSTSLFTMRFADDTNVVGSGNNKEETELNINLELDNLYQWFCKNKLSLHPDKSRFIVHTRDKLLNIALGGRNLMRCGYGLQEEGVKFLGVIIDENLDWKLQTKHVTKKISKANYLLWRYKNRLNLNMKKTVYESFVRSHITYCLSVWGAKKTAELASLKKQLKKIWTKIGRRLQHTNDRLIELNILKLEDELKLKEVKLIWRWEKKRIPLGLSNIIEERNLRVLRSRQFIREHNWRPDSVAYRLATRATNEIKDIVIAKSKRGLCKKYKNNIILIGYVIPCRVRNCRFCA